MSILKVDEIRNSAGNGSPDFPFGMGGRTITLTDDSTIDIKDIFPLGNKDGEYLVMGSNDNQTFGVFIYKQGTPSNAKIINGSANFVGSDTDGNLCLFQDTVDVNNILLKNRLGSALNFRVYRRGV